MKYEGLLDFAIELVSRQAKPFKPKQFKDSYRGRTKALVQKKAKGFYPQLATYTG
jgi:non-homologous end joining protein Ku